MATYLSRLDRRDLGRAQDVASELEMTADDEKGERLARAAWQALSNLNAHIEKKKFDSSVGEFRWSEAGD